MISWNDLENTAAVSLFTLLQCTSVDFMLSHTHADADCGFQMFPPMAMEEQVHMIGVDIDYKLELNCAGPRHAFFMDKDGSLTGMSF